MHQPDLGVKVSALRQQKGLTQERLGQLCEVSPRAIQRIERGEVEPRAHTLQRLGDALEFDFGGRWMDHERLWLAVLHLSSAVLGVIVTLLIWSSQKNRSRRIDVDGRQVLNFQITMALLMFAFGLCVVAGLVATPLLPGWAKENEDFYGKAAVWLPLLGLAPMILMAVYSTIEGVINTVRTLSDKRVHYAPSIPFVK